MDSEESVGNGAVCRRGLSAWFRSVGSFERTRVVALFAGLWGGLTLRLSPTALGAFAPVPFSTIYLSAVPFRRCERKWRRRGHGTFA
ncbi:MAG: hypothetical protein J6X44_08740 [Thermoguttaceae bacterium]|nr:hypothetical protein [Thermoguttaceae bacterium]